MNSQKGFIQIPILIAIILGVIVVGGAGYVGVKQYQSHQAKTLELSEVERLRQEVDDLKKQTDSQKSSAQQTTKKPSTVPELKAQNPQQYKNLVNENKTQLLEATKILSNKKIIARVKPSVVYIETASGSGSGIVVGTDGYVLTNAHVVTGITSATVKLTDGRSLTGSVVGRDENVDLALLKIGVTGLAAAFLGDSDLVEQGDLIFTFGYPLGIEGDVAFKDGTLSRRQKIENTTYLEISAQILPGNSGGPLVNQAGEVIGVNTLAIGANKVGGILIGETLKYALPINVAKNLIPELKSGRNVIVPKITETIPAPPTPSPTPAAPPPPSCTADIYSCNDWSACSGSFGIGLQTRSCTKTFTCPTAYTPTPSTQQSCTPPSPPPFAFNPQVSMEPGPATSGYGTVHISVPEPFYGCVWIITQNFGYYLSQAGGVIHSGETITEKLKLGEYKYDLQCEATGHTGTQKTGLFKVLEQGMPSCEELPNAWWCK